MNNFISYEMSRRTGEELSVVQCGYQKCPPNHTFGPNKRDYYLMHFIVEGEGKLVRGDYEYEMSKGMGWLISPEEVTVYRASSENPWSYYWIGFVGTKAKEILDYCSITQLKPVFSFDENGIIPKYFQQAVTFDKERTSIGYVCVGYLYLILAELIKTLRSEEVCDVLDKAVDYIERNYVDVTVESLSKECFISRSHLFRLFKTKLGVSPKTYITDMRLKKADELLTSEKLSIGQISLSVGYENCSLFIKQFKNKYGVAPSEKRKAANRR